MLRTVARSRLASKLAPYAFLFGTFALGCGAESKADDDDDDGKGAAGMKGMAGSGGMKPMITCPDPNEAIDPTATIDNLEDGDANLAIGDHTGGWWTASDDTPGGSMVPVQTEISGELARPELLPEERCGSLMAMRVTGQGFTDWGAVIGLNFGWGPVASGGEDILPFDASARTGVEFWARIGDTSTNQVRYQVSDSNSEPAGGKCVVDGGDGLECYDSFGTDLPSLDTTWHRYKIPFAGLTQRDFGLEADGVLTTEIYQISFNFLTPTPFDFWVDDVSFY
jgi:hypothetical protein